MLDDFSAINDPTDFSALRKAELAQEAAHKMSQIKEQLGLEVDPDDFRQVQDLEDEAFFLFKNDVTAFGIASLRSKYKIKPLGDKSFSMTLLSAKDADSVEVSYSCEFYKADGSSENHLNVFRKQRKVTYLLADGRSAEILEDCEDERSAYTLLEIFERVEFSE